MTDEQMDARLRAAGERFRAGTIVDETAPAGEPHDVARPTAARRSAGRRWSLIASAAAVAAALVVGGTLAVQNLTNHDGTPTGTTAPLEGTVWQLLGYGSERNPNSSTTFYIGSDGQLVADDACMVFSAKANVSDGHLYPTDIEERQRSCVDSNAPTFTTGVDILTTPATYSLHGDALTVSDGHTAMHLEALPGAVPPTSDVPTLTETQWRLAEAISPNGNVTLGRGESFTITDGRLKASDGCNTLTTAAAQTGNRVDLKSVHSTRLPCPSNGVDPVIDDVLSSGSIEQVVLGGRLTLSKKGAGTLVYAWIPADAHATDPSVLTGPTWHIAGVAQHASVGAATLRVSDSGRYVANDGCSQFTGKADIGHGTIRLHGVPGKPSCGGSAGAQAATIDSYLSVRTLWSIRGGDLVIDGGSAQANSLVYTNGVPAPTGTTTGLNGTTWQLIGVTSGSAPLTLTPKNAAIRLGFVNKGKIDYDNGVNTAEGTVTIRPGTLLIDSLTQSAVGCATSPPCTQASLIDRVFTGTPSWSITGDQLTITETGVGRLVYQLTSSPSDSSAPPSSTPSGDPSVLYGKTWRLYSLEHDGANSGSGMSASAKVTVDFESSGNFTLAFPCGDENATISFDPGSATVHEPVAVGAGTPCTSGGGDAHSSDVAPVLSVLAAGDLTWSVTGGTLTLARSISGGRETLIFHSS